MADFPKDLREVIIKHLRRIGYRNIHYKKSMAAAHKGYGEWQCCECKKITSRDDLHGDHTDPVIETTKGFIDWNTYMERLFLGMIQPLCKECHKQKSIRENRVRKDKRDGWEKV